MAKKKNNINDKKIVLFIIMFIFGLISILSLTGFYFQFSSIDYGNTSNGIDGKNYNAEIINVDDIDTDKLFNEIYYKALDLYSTTVAQGTTWLEICPNSQTTVDNNILFKVCSTEYPTITSLKKSLKTVFADNFVEEKINKNYVEYENDFYIVPEAIERDSRYVGLDDQKANSVTTNKVIYTVTSKYADLGCGDNCKYDYKNHKFIIEYLNGEWKVSNLEMPY